MKFTKQEILEYYKDRNEKLKVSPNFINIFGVRRRFNPLDNEFDDVIGVLINNDNSDKEFTNATFEYWNATTDPGRYWFDKKFGVGEKGVAILPSGSYKFSVGKHRNSYPALVQGEEFSIVRTNKGFMPSISDINNLIEDGEVDKGWFGINIHRAAVWSTHGAVDRWSAGCQVIQKIKDWEKFWGYVETHVKFYPGYKITYTLFEEKQTY